MSPEQIGIVLFVLVVVLIAVARHRGVDLLLRQEAAADERVRALMALQTVLSLRISHSFLFAHRVRGGSPTAERESYCSERRMQ